MDVACRSVLFEDAYELVAFLELLRRRFDVVRVKNRFQDFDPEAPGEFRNVLTNVSVVHRGRPFVAEVQLRGVLVLPLGMCRQVIVRFVFKFVP